jgi:hypothetical protein
MQSNVIDNNINIKDMIKRIVASNRKIRDIDDAQNKFDLVGEVAQRFVDKANETYNEHKDKHYVRSDSYKKIMFEYHRNSGNFSDVWGDLSNEDKNLITSIINEAVNLYEKSKGNNE